MLLKNINSFITHSFSFVFISIKKGHKEACHIFLKFYIDEEYNHVQKNICELLYNTFHESYSIQEQMLMHEGNYQ